MSSESGHRSRRRLPIASQRVLHQIKANFALMRWPEGIEDENGDPCKPSPIVSGSLADQFWNKDVPRLIAQVERSLRDAK